MEENKRQHYALVDAIAKHGTREDKRHGYYYTVNVYGGFSLKLDTWSAAITVLKNGKNHDYLGMDFGGFTSKTTMVKFWLAHKSLFTKTK